MKTILVYLVLLSALAPVVASDSDESGKIEATTMLNLPVDSVTIYPDGLATVERKGQMEVTEGVHKFVLDLPWSVIMDSVRFIVSNATVEKIVYDDNTEYHLNVSSTGLQNFSLSYLMRDAGQWAPSYSLYLGDESVLVSAYAIVENDFGEDLKDVRLKLVAGPPQLESYAPRAAEPLYYAVEEAVEDEAGISLAKVSVGGSTTGELETLYIYVLEGRNDLDMDSIVGLPFFEEVGPLERIYTWDAAYQSDGPVMETVKANNSMKDPWPPGEALLYRNGEYVSRISVPYTPTGTEASIKVGSSADVEVSKELANYTINEEIREITGTGNTTFVVKVTTEIWTYLLSIESNADRDVFMEITDRKPLKAEIVSVNSEPSETTATSLKWELGLEPRQELDLEYAYKIVTTESVNDSK